MKKIFFSALLILGFSSENAFAQVNNLKKAGKLLPGTWVMSESKSLALPKCPDCEEEELASAFEVMKDVRMIMEKSGKLFYAADEVLLAEGTWKLTELSQGAVTCGMLSEKGTVFCFAFIDAGNESGDKSELVMISEDEIIIQDAGCAAVLVRTE